MLNFLKFEFRKRFVQILIVGIITLLCEITFLIYLYVNNNGTNLLLTQFIIFSIYTIATLYFFIDGILAYSSELKNKKGYMIFLAPCSLKKILLSKLLYALCTVIACTLIYAFIIIFNIHLIFVKWPSLKESVHQGILALSQFTSFSFLSTMFLDCINSFIQFLALITLGYLAATISTLLLSHKKYKFILTISLFLGLYILIAYIHYKIQTTLPGYTSYMRYTSQSFDLSTKIDIKVLKFMRYSIASSLIYYSIIGVINFLITNYLLSKKIDL